MTNDPLVRDMAVDHFRVECVDPGTVYMDEPSEEVPPGWYVVGDRIREDYERRVVVKVEEAWDDDNNDVRAEFAKKLASLITEHFGGGGDDA